MVGHKGFPGGSVVKKSACQCRRCRRHVFNPWVRKIPWRRKWQPTPDFLPGKSHGQRSLAGYSPWGRSTVGQFLVAKQEQCHFYYVRTSNDYTVEVRNIFRGLDLIDRVPDELWTEVSDIVQEAVIKTIPKKKK